MKNNILITALIIVLLIFSGAYSDETESFRDLLNIKVLSAGFFEMDAKYATGNAQVIDRNLINQYHIQSLSELFDGHINGASIHQHEGMGDLIAIRGIGIDNNAKTLVLYNGSPLNYRVHFGFFDFSSPLIGDVHIVESILGPGGILWGSGAINNFVNIITPTGEDREGLWGHAELGVHNLQGIFEASYGHVLNEKKKFSAFVYGGVADNRGVQFKQDVPASEWFDNYGGVLTESELDLYRLKELDRPNYKFSGRLSLLEPSEFFNFDLNARYSYVSKSADAVGHQALFVTAGDSYTNALGVTNYYSEETAYSNNLAQGFENIQPTGAAAFTGKDLLINIKSIMNFNKDNSLELTPYLKVSTAFTRVKKRFRDEVIDVIGTNHLEPEESNRAGNSEYHTGINAIYKTRSIKHNLLAVGAEFGFKKFSSNDIGIYGDEDYSGDWEQSLMDWKELSFFGEDVLILGKMHLSAGIRGEFVYFSDYHVPADKTNIALSDTITIDDSFSISPRAALAVEINQKNNLKVSYQKGYRFPDAAYYGWKSIFTGLYDPWIQNLDDAKADLKPEQLHSLEFTYAYTPVSESKKNVSLEVSGFANYYKDTLGWVLWMEKYPTNFPSGDVFSNYYSNAGDSRAYPGWWGSFGNSDVPFWAVGGEITFDARNLFDRLDLRVGYSISLPVDYSETTLVIANATGETWTRAPKHAVKGRAAVRIGKKISASLTSKWQSGIKFEEEEYNSTLFSNAAPRREKGKFNLDIAVKIDPTENLSMIISGKNLIPGSTPQLTYYTPGYAKEAHVVKYPGLNFSIVAKF